MSTEHYRTYRNRILNTAVPLIRTKQNNDKNICLQSEGTRKSHLFAALHITNLTRDAQISGSHLLMGRGGRYGYLNIRTWTSKLTAAYRGDKLVA